MLHDDIQEAIKALENAIKALLIAQKCVDQAALKLRHLKPRLVVDNDRKKRV